MLDKGVPEPDPQAGIVRMGADTAPHRIDRRLGLTPPQIGIGDSQPLIGAIKSTEDLVTEGRESRIDLGGIDARLCGLARQRRAPLSGVARCREEEACPDQLQRGAFQPAESPQAETGKKREAEHEQPPDQPRLLRNRLRASQAPTRIRTMGAAQSGQVSGSTGGS